MQLAGTIDVPFVLDIEQRKSVIEYIFFLAKVAIYYKYKLQILVATSAKEAEFIAAITTAKYLLNICKVFLLIHADNIAAINITNDNRPTSCNHCINISWFTLQT